MDVPRCNVNSLGYFVDILSADVNETFCSLPNPLFRVFALELCPVRDGQDPQVRSMTDAIMSI